MAGEDSVLRGLPSLDRPLPEFAADAAPDEPVTLFGAWLRDAIEAGVAEPHAMTLSTIGADGAPAARVLILKAFDADGFQFATSADSPKGADLQARPAAALTFYWSHFGRQVRVRGEVHRAPSEVSAQDFLERSVEARAAAIAGRQSSRLTDPEDLESAIADAARKLEAQPEYVSSTWTRYVLRPAEVEFWQGNAQRRHTRLRYRRDGAGWVRELLWP
ncbi:MAG TPA: pyridoxal 5'-phosphate synthase [Mycobacteriales bacterium]|nr:pyridoxal 5'-phosphate synthase [Mycobacteriales bacterium]